VVHLNFFGDKGACRGLWIMRWAVVVFAGCFTTKYLRSDASHKSCLGLRILKNCLLLCSRPGMRALAGALKDKLKLTWLGIAKSDLSVEGRLGGEWRRWVKRRWAKMASGKSFLFCWCGGLGA
jgi:hypothetical protein